VSEGVVRTTGLAEPVVHTGDQDVLERNHPFLLGAIIFQCGDQFLKRIFAVDRHDLRTHFVGGPVQGHSEPKLLRFSG